MLDALEQSTPDTTVAELRAGCASQRPADAAGPTPVATPPDQGTGGNKPLVIERIERERAAQQTRSVLIAHKRNYLLPITYNRKPNNAPFAGSDNEVLQGQRLDRWEAKFQVSLKFSLADGLLTPEDEVYFGFTTKSFWQVYNREISAPFRETNYEPELFWITPIKWTPLGADASLLTLGFSHESNGRSGTLSRGWNRLYANLVLEKKRFVFSLKPWWRIPESSKSSPEDPTGDDNPDIDEFLGHFEFRTLYRRKDNEFGLMLRNNLRSNNRGAVQLDWTFPLWRSVRGYAQYFNGYGESLIDYNARVERFGIGILLTDLL